MTARLEITTGLQLAAGVARRHGAPDPTLGARSIVPGPDLSFAGIVSIVSAVLIITVPRWGALFGLGCGLGHGQGWFRAGRLQEA